MQEAVQTPRKQRTRQQTKTNGNRWQTYKATRTRKQLKALHAINWKQVDIQSSSGHQAHTRKAASGRQTNTPPFPKIPSDLKQVDVEPIEISRTHSGAPVTSRQIPTLLLHNRPKKVRGILSRAL
ncbi:unnamed protein product [Ectocarpus sp. 12 AP-2014]